MSAEPLRIAQLAPIAMPVRPGVGDSIEQLVSLLTDELVRRGHEVTLFATGDSETSAKLEAAYPRGYEEDPELWDWRFHETLHAARALEGAERFDVVHSHAYHFALPFGRFVETPVLHTHHVELDPEVVRAYSDHPEAKLVATSEFQRRSLGELGDVRVIHHGIDTSAFPFGPVRGEHLLFLGRMIPDKGPREAVRVAREVDMPLIMAGPASDYFHAEVEPLIDGRRVRYVGPVEAAERAELLAGAAALLYPIAYPEPFGLVLVEAMACGTPVAAFELGAVPEIVEDGVTGQLAPPGSSLADRVAEAVELDRERVRSAALARFDYRRMVDEHEALYRDLAARRRIAAT